MRAAPAKRIAALAGALLLAAVAGTVVGRVVRGSAPQTAAPPYSSAAGADVGAGRILFMRYCSFCHGADGRGNGVAAKALVPPPVDLGAFAARRWTDAQLFTKITQGEPGTAMPAWGGVLSERQRWDIVAFIRADVQKG